MPKEKLGQKIYKFNGDELIVKRLIKVKNSDAFVIGDEDCSNPTTITNAEYRSYTKLREDAVVIFSIVELQDGVPDVIVSLFRDKDIKANMPYAVCRQNLFDVFSNSIENDGGMMYIGCSISQDTCPENVDFRMLIGCNKVNRSDMVAIYMEDNIDVILSLVKSKPYDETLAILHKGFSESKTRGSVSTLRELLVENRFIDDVYRGFNIIKVNFTYDGNEQFLPEFTAAIEDIIKREMLYPVWVKWTKEIDIKSIQDEHLLVLDETNTLYIVSYKPGDYINRPYAAMNDMTEVEALRNLV